MVFEREECIARIIDRLTFLKSKVEISNSINLTGVNIISENFYRDLLNLVFGYNLRNLNALKQNADTIDLGDEDQKICFQITSTSGLPKTRKTVTGFIKNKWYEKYDRLIILNIVSKTDHQDPKIGDASYYELDTKEDIWDVSSLLKVINDKELEQIQEICSFLDKNVKIQSDETLAKEITTFMSLVLHLSDESHPSAGTGYIEEPDPDGKINRRFASHSAFLKKEFQDLFVEYGAVLQNVLDQADLGLPRIRRLGLFLKTESDQFLTDAGGDPEKALATLVDNYAALLSKHGKEFDLSAIRFFLVDQLIKCNVFPNKVEVA